jgi:hypothetical protein
VPLTAGGRLGPYEILAPLGTGGMGEVYRPCHARLQRIRSASLRWPLSRKSLGQRNPTVGQRLRRVFAHSGFAPSLKGTRYRASREIPAVVADVRSGSTGSSTLTPLPRQTPAPRNNVQICVTGRRFRTFAERFRFHVQPHYASVPATPGELNKPRPSGGLGRVNVSSDGSQWPRRYLNSARSMQSPICT